MKRFLIIPNYNKKNSHVLAVSLAHWLVEHGLMPYVDDRASNDATLAPYYARVKDVISSMDCVIVLGGDGTILNASREIASYNVPILGINTGNLGFLAEIDSHSFETALNLILQGDYSIENRMMLDSMIESGRSEIYAGLALNDIVASRIAISRHNQ